MKGRVEYRGPRTESKCRGSGMELRAEPGDEEPDCGVAVSQGRKARRDRNK